MSSRTLPRLRLETLQRGLFVVTALVVLGAFMHAFIVAPGVMFAGTIVTRVNTTEKVVALTFDDGPLPNTTEETLTILRDKGITATFFVIGKEAARHPAQLKAIVADGHVIGNHSYSHRALVFVSPTTVHTEVSATDALIRSAGYEGTIPFRAPYNAKLVSLPLYLARHDRIEISRDVLPAEGTKQTTEAIRQSVVSQVKPGSIILLHPMYDHTATTREALGLIIDDLKQDGYRFVTIPELLAIGDVQD